MSGDFQRIKPDQKRVMGLMSDFQKAGISLVPSTLVEQVNPLSQEERLIFQSEDKSLLLVFLSKKIDIIFENNGGIYSFGYENLLPNIISVLSANIDIKAERIAFVKYFLADASVRENVDALFHRVYKIDKEDGLDEWSFRILKRESLNFSQKKEIANNILKFDCLESSIKFMSPLGNMAEENDYRYALELDFNTDHKNKSDRFDFDDLVPFAHEAAKKVDSNIDKFGLSFLIEK